MPREIGTIIVLTILPDLFLFAVFRLQFYFHLKEMTSEDKLVATCLKLLGSGLVSLIYKRVATARRTDRAMRYAISVHNRGSDVLKAVGIRPCIANLPTGRYRLPY